jgi:DNA-binding HxlR family transcriptional regulator
MYKYGQYCPIARAAEILGDRWTLLIVRDLLNGARHFSELERGLPGISKALLANRLRHLRDVGVLEKRRNNNGRKTTEYHLTPAGEELQTVMQALQTWGARWGFGEPDPEELDPLLLLWWIRGRVRQDCLPDERTVVEFNFHGAADGSYWLVLTTTDVSLCLQYPGYEVDVVVTADLASFFQVWLGWMSYADALSTKRIEVEALPGLARDFPNWFAWSPAFATVRAERSGRRGQPSLSSNHSGANAAMDLHRASS